MSYQIAERQVTVYDVVKDGVIKSTLQSLVEAENTLRWFEDRDAYISSGKRTLFGDAYWSVQDTEYMREYVREWEM